jgi:hypothetical protein
MPDYKRHDPKGWCGDPRRGAAMGRNTYQDELDTYDGKLSLRRIHLNGDYDSNGTYWGYTSGTSLYWVANEELTIDYVIRIHGFSREVAKNKVREDYPNARFYR